MTFRLPSVIPSIHSVALPIDAQDVHLGVTDPYAAALNREHSIKVIQAQARFHKLNSEYLRSYTQRQPPTLSQFKDLLLSLCLSYLIRTAQTKDVSAQQLTYYSQQWWSQKSYSDAWTNIDGSNYKSVLGSLSYYIDEQSLRSANAVDLISTALKNFWSTHQIDYELAPKIKFNKLYEYLGITPAQLNIWEKCLSTLELLDQQDLNPAKEHLREYLLDESSYNSMSLRLLLGEVHPNIIKCLGAIYTLAESKLEYLSTFNLESVKYLKPLEIYAKLFSLFPPAGPPLAFIALGIEGVFRAAQLIIDQLEDQPTLGTIQYDSFLVDSSLKDLRHQIAEWISLTYDSWEVLGTFNTLYGAEGTAYRCYQQCIELIEEADYVVSGNSPRRLGLFRDITEALDYYLIPTVNSSQNELIIPATNQLPVLPLQDAVFASVNDIWEQHQTYGYIDYVSVSSPANSSHGSSVNHSLGLPALNSISPYIRLIESAYKRIQGLSNKQSSRFAGWSKKQLNDVHKLSEIPAVGKLLAAAGVPHDLLGYGISLLEAGMHSATTAAAYVPDPAHGHTIKKSTALEQTNAEKIQQEASVIGIDAGTYHIASHQHVTNTRFMHHTSDLFQAGYQQRWVRVENQDTNISRYSVEVVTAAKSEFLESKRSFIGNYYQYADNYFIQVKHEEKSFGRNSSFGGRFTVGAEGSITLQSRSENMNLSASGLISLNAKEGSVHINSQDASTNITGTTSVNLYSEGAVSIKSDETVAIDGTTVIINQGMALDVTSISEFTEINQQVPPEMKEIEIKSMAKQPAPIPSPGTKQFPRQAEPAQTKGGPSIGAGLGPAGSIFNKIIKDLLK